MARGSTVESLSAEAMARLDRNLWRRAAETLLRGGATDQKCAAQIAAVAGNPDATFADTLLPFFTEKGEGDAAKWVGKTSGLKTDEALRALLLEAE